MVRHPAFFMALPVMASGVLSSVPSAAPAEKWEFLEWDALKPSRSSSVCITCQHFRYEVGRHCLTVLTCPNHQCLIPQGEHLTKRCAQWVLGVRWRLSDLFQRSLVLRESWISALPTTPLMVLTSVGAETFCSQGRR